MSASGSPTYQWQVNSGSGWANVSTIDGSSGQTALSYTTGVLASSNDQYQYRVLVTYGNGTITSNPATLSVKYLTIAAQPQAATIVSGNTNTFTVSATGTANVTIHYQWHLNGAIVGTDSASYTTPVTGNGDNGDQVYVVVSDGGLVAPVTSATVTLTVSPVAIITVPPATTVQANVGDTPTLSITATNATTYQWESCVYGLDCTQLANWNPIAGATASSYQLPAVTTANDGTQYNVIVGNGNGTLTSSVLALSVSYVEIDAFEGYSEVASGDTAKFKVVAHGTIGATLAYQWHVVTNGGVIGGLGDSPIPGATSSTYQITGASSALDGEMIYVVVTNGLTVNAIPGAATSGAVTLQVD